MILTVNGKNKELPDNSTLSNLLQQISQENERIAIEVNAEIIPKSNYAEFLLKNNDKVEIIKAVGGG
jgi:sulfur carrier protein